MAVAVTAVMLKEARLALGLACLLAAGEGCSYNAFSPPARAISLESAAPVKPGETMVGVRGGAFGAVFEPTAIVGTGGVRHGVAPHVEVNVEGTYARVEDGEEYSSQINKNAGAARVGVKAGNANVSFTGGVGGGLSAMGGFAAADAGGVLAYANCYVVPFLAPGMFVSVPTAARTLRFENGRTSSPGAAFGLTGTAGLEVQLHPGRCREGRTAPRLQVGFNLQYIWGRHTSTDGDVRTAGSFLHAVAGLGVGLEFPLSI
jgi:hypothetical protein